MRTLLKNGQLIDVFMDQLVKENVLLEENKIIGIGDYSDADADVVEDLEGKIICPGLIDGHIHIESSMLRPAEFARICLRHGTTTVIADPHEITNVAGLVGFSYMLDASAGLPMTIHYVMPSCVPATGFDEAGSRIEAEDLQLFYHHPNVIGLGEVMNYPGVILRDKGLMNKIEETKRFGKIINGHAPLLSGRDLDRYITAGIFDDHECSSWEEALERIHKGQWIMVRQGTAARNLEALQGLFEEPYSRRCLLVTDDKHPADLLEQGHIDSIIRQVKEFGKNPLVAVRMASFQAAQRFGLTELGAIAPGYDADLLILEDMDSFAVKDVYYKGKKVVENRQVLPFDEPQIRPEVWRGVRNSFFMEKMKPEDFMIEVGDSLKEEQDSFDESQNPNVESENDLDLVKDSDMESQIKLCRVIEVIPKQLITREKHVEINFQKKNGIDLERDIIKLAVVERHNHTGHVGLGFAQGMGLKSGAIASSVSHDSHNLIVLGTSEEDMTVAANAVRRMSGGLVVVNEGKVLKKMPLPIAGLMGEKSAKEMAKQNEVVRKAVKKLGCSDDIDPFMNLAFVSLPVIPDLKMTTHGLVDVNKQELVELFVEEENKVN